jgi:cbb3-type cytochrome oxidase maturation protein
MSESDFNHVLHPGKNSICRQIKKTMEILYLMIGLSLFMAIGFLVDFIWSIKSGQQEDLETPALRILN